MLLDLFTDSFREPPECAIKLGTAGEEVESLYAYLVDLTVNTSRQQPASATMVFETRRDEMGQWAVEDQELLVPWSPIIIEAVFGERTEEIMRGYIREVNADYPSDFSARVTVHCQDDSLVLDRETKKMVWGTDDVPTSDSLIVTQIAGDAGLMPHPDSAEGRSGIVVNQTGTDLAFLQTRAKVNGFELLFEQGQLYFGPMRLDAEPQSTILVYAGEDTHCVSMSVKADGHKPDKVIVQTMAASGAEDVEHVIEPDLIPLGPDTADSTGTGLQDFTYVMKQDDVVDEEDLVAMAQAKANEFNMKIHAEGELDSMNYAHVLKVGYPVPVDGLGSVNSGIYYVDSVVHQFTQDSYKQRFKLLRNAYGDNVDAGVSSVLAGIL